MSPPCAPLVPLRDVQGVRQGPVECAQVMLKVSETASSGIREAAVFEIMGC